MHTAGPTAPEATLRCPACSTETVERMPTDACLFFWTCPACGVRHRPLHGDCCVFCSYGSEPCPPVQQSAPVHCSDPAVKPLDHG